MKEIRIHKPEVVEGTLLKVSFTASKEMQKYFTTDTFTAEYDCDISGTPDSVLVIPLLSNLLPIMWLTQGTIYAEELDSVFYENIPHIRKGYEGMLPLSKLGGGLLVTSLEKNTLNPTVEPNVCFFSGGVDAFYTLLSILDEKPLLLSVWGSDIKQENVNGWSKVSSHLNEVAQDFGLRNFVIKSNFRDMMSYSALSTLLPREYEWWHDVQHGIALIALGAPICPEKLYISSSFTEEFKGRYVCASDPTIDEYMKWGTSQTIHYGYHASRQDKAKLICDYWKSSQQKLNLRVCWESDSGKNCCACEKCYRTILEIVSEGYDPNDFGFKWTEHNISKAKKFYLYQHYGKQFSIDMFYPQIKNSFLLHQKNIPNFHAYRWVVDMDWDKSNKLPCKFLARRIKFLLNLPRRILRKSVRIVKKWTGG